MFSIDILKQKEILTENQAENLTDIATGKVFSFFYETRLMLYLGIFLLTTGLGILVYLNIDTIGHQAIIATIGLATTYSFFYVHRRASPFSVNEQKSPGILYDYILLLGCLLFVLLLTYLQYQYDIFKNAYNIASLIAGGFFMTMAYRYDHKGVLSLGITGLGSWIGLSIKPLDFWSNDFYGNTDLIITGMCFGMALLGVGRISQIKNIKKHFAHIYYNFGFNLLFLAILAALFSFKFKLGWFVALGLVGLGAWFYAKKEHSFYYLLLALVYFYIGLTYILLDFMADELWLYYFIVSCGGVVWLLFNYKKVLQ